MTDGWNDGWPDWRDAGRTVEIESEEGDVVSGELYVENHFFDGEDEIPVFVVLVGVGDRRSFGGAKRWWYVTPSVHTPAE